MSDTATPPRRPSYFHSRGLRFFFMLLLIVVMTVPIGLVALVVEDRTGYRNDAMREVSGLWGGPVTIGGPAIVIPVTRRQVIETETKDGDVETEQRDVDQEPLVLFADTSDTHITSASQIRRRGIFEVPVFTADATLTARFDTARLNGVLSATDTAHTDRARLVLFLPGSRSFIGAATATVNGRAVDLEPGTSLGGVPGIQAPIALPAAGAFDATIGFQLNGAGTLQFAPLARQTDVRLTSDWPDPSFQGAFLPSEHDVTTDGFSAHWSVPHLARDLPQVSRGSTHLSGHESPLNMNRYGYSGATGFGVDFIRTVDVYTLASRAVKYGILFIALTFLTVFLMERTTRHPVHPAQYVLIGVAQTVFFLLLLSLAEQVGFLGAYLAASGATVALISYYGAAALRLNRRVWILSALLVLLYGVLYLILRSADNALIAGSLLAFGAVAGAMIATRHERWSAPPAAQ